MRCLRPFSSLTRGTVEQMTSSQILSKGVPTPINQSYLLRIRRHPRRLYIFETYKKKERQEKRNRCFRSPFTRSRDFSLHFRDLRFACEYTNNGVRGFLPCRSLSLSPSLQRLIRFAFDEKSTSSYTLQIISSKFK